MVNTDTVADEVLNALNEAVHDALQKKRMLGQYAVVDHNGVPETVPSEQLFTIEKALEEKLHR